MEVDLNSLSSPQRGIFEEQQMWHRDPGVYGYIRRRRLPPDLGCSVNQMEACATRDGPDVVYGVEPWVEE